MPDYRAEGIDANGQPAVRVFTATSDAEAAEHARALGIQPRRLKRLPSPIANPTPRLGPEDLATHRSRPVHSRSATPVRDFLHFKLLVTPVWLRFLFYLVTLACLIMAVLVPISYINDYRAALTPQNRVGEQIEQVRAFIRWDEANQAAIQNAEAEVNRFRDRQGFTIALNEAQAKLDALTDERQRRANEAAIIDPDRAQQRLDELRAQSTNRRAPGPSPIPYLLEFLLIPVIWLAARIFLEFIAVLFSIHDRLIEIESQQRRSADTDR